MRHSLKGRRDQERFDQAHTMLEALQECETQGEIQLFYFDEAGISLMPCIPSAWQPIGQTLEVPVNGHRRLNLLGFLDRHSRCYIRSVEGTVNTETVITAMEAFIERFAEPERLTLVFMDNARLHPSELFQAQRERWLLKRVVVCYLPPYSPELNLIEILWRKIKYEWLPLSAYLSFDDLKAAVSEVIGYSGKKYRITFV